MSREDRYFGGKPGAAREAKAKMEKTYGKKDAEHVFRSVIAKGKRREKSPRKR